MKLDLSQIKALNSKSTATSRSRVSDIMLTAGKPLSKSEIAKLSDIHGARPEHNVSSQFTYLRTEGYVIKEVEPSLYLILATPTGDVPEYAIPFVQSMLGITPEPAITKEAKK